MNLWRKLRGMSAFTTVIVRVSKTKAKRQTVGKKSARNFIYLVSSWIFFDVSFDFEAYVVVAFGLKKEIYLLAAKIPPRCPPCFLLWFSREHNARVHLTFLLNEMFGYSRLCERLRSSAIIWKQLLQSSAIRDRLRAFAIIWKPAFREWKHYITIAIPAEKLGWYECWQHICFCLRVFLSLALSQNY